MAVSWCPTTLADPSAVDFAWQRSAVDAALASLCDRRLDALPRSIAGAVSYALLTPGKRLRPVLLLSAYDAAGGKGDATSLAAAVEVVHAYSLVHDDLPCMDDDDVRRGRPTTHRAHGVRAATSAGVAMVPLAALAACDGARELGLAPVVVGRIVRELMAASGASGMVGGQLLDLQGEGMSLTVADLERIHGAKTGALIAASARIGGIAAGVDDARERALDAYGRAVGLAFQIADDVLDETSTTAELGKTAGRDAVLGKSTYPALLGVDGASERAKALSRQACAALDEVGMLSPPLEELARFAASRRS